MASVSAFDLAGAGKVGHGGGNGVVGAGVTRDEGGGDAGAAGVGTLMLPALSAAEGTLNPASILPPLRSTPKAAAQSESTPAASDPLPPIQISPALPANGNQIAVEATGAVFDDAAGGAEQNSRNQAVQRLVTTVLKSRNLVRLQALADLMRDHLCEDELATYLYAYKIEEIAKQRGKRCPEVAEAMFDRGTAYMKMAQYDKVFPLYTDCLNILTATLGANHERVGEIQNGLADLYATFSAHLASPARPLPGTRFPCG